MPAVTLIHSDRGSQYTTHFFNHFIDEFDLIQSMSRAGKCIDNGPMESFRGTIKEEMYRLKTYDTFEALEANIHRYITFYDEEREMLSIGYRFQYKEKTNPKIRLNYFYYLPVSLTEGSS